MRIAIATTEMLGTGRRISGVADAVMGLSRSLIKKGHQVSVLLPLTQRKYLVHNDKHRIDTVSVPFRGEILKTEVFGVSAREQFGPDLIYIYSPIVRMADAREMEKEGLLEKRLGLFFSRAAAAYLAKLNGNFDIIHPHTGVDFLSYFAKTNGLKTPIVYTLQRLEQGDALSFSPEEFRELTDISYKGTEVINPYIFALNHADRIIIPGEQYAEELIAGLPKRERYAEAIAGNKYKFNAFMFGADDNFNPTTLHKRGLIPYSFSPDELQGKEKCHIALQQEMGFEKNPRIPIVAWSQRLVEEKGISELSGLTNSLIGVLRKKETAPQQKGEFQVVIFGRGNADMQNVCAMQAAKYPKNIAFHKFDPELADLEPRILAGSDIAVFPYVEGPFALNALKAMRLGTLPLATSVGSLAEIITDNENGFIIPDGDPEQIKNRLAHTAQSVFQLFRTQKEQWWAMQRNAMLYNSGWDKPADKHLAVYEQMVNGR